MRAQQGLAVTIMLLMLAAPSTQAQQITQADRLVTAALERTRHFVIYDGSYRKITYPGGDVPALFGVCSDVVVRSYRTLGIDLQQLVHEDMTANFNEYPAFWGLPRPDPNIDHRRVPNLQRFFTRHGQSFRPSGEAKAYMSGDIVTWNLREDGSLPHIGIVTNRLADDGTPMVVHNIGYGPRLENMLFDYEITGHYRYLPEP